jgi:hypothetical protein
MAQKLSLMSPSGQRTHVPQQTALLLDHLVSARQQRRRDGEAGITHLWGMHTSLARSTLTLHS